MHKVVEPNILYFGTPVVLVSTENEDGSANLAPMSSAWWLDTSCMLGMSGRSQTMRNLLRTGECVLNLPSVSQVDAVDRLALLTGRNPVPEAKQRKGYRYERDKFGVAGLTETPSHLVRPPRALECPVQMEAVLLRRHQLGDEYLVAAEVRVVRVHLEENLLLAGTTTHIDPDKWRPLIMNFCEFYGLGDQVHPSRLATIFAPSADDVA